MSRKTNTSTAVKQRWIDKTYKQYRISLRLEDDAELIDFVDNAKQHNIGVTDIFRAGIATIQNEIEIK